MAQPRPNPKDWNRSESKIAGSAFIVRKLVQAATLQKAFASLNTLDNSEFVEIARECGVRLGAGAALSPKHFSGSESVPDFPLNMVESA